MPPPLWVLIRRFEQVDRTGLPKLSCCDDGFVAGAISWYPMETFGVVTLTETASWSLFVAIRFYQAITQGLERWGVDLRYPSPYVVPDRMRYSPRVGTLHGAKMRRSVQLVRRVKSHSALFGYRSVLGIA